MWLVVVAAVGVGVVGGVLGFRVWLLQTPARVTVEQAVDRFRSTPTSGSSTGTSVTDLWLDPHTGLPWRQTSTASTGNDTVIGHVTFDEHIDLRLQSTTPLT